MRQRLCGFPASLPLLATLRLPGGHPQPQGILQSYDARQRRGVLLPPTPPASRPLGSTCTAYHRHDLQLAPCPQVQPWCGSAPPDARAHLASAPTFSRLEHSIDRKDLYRLTRAFVAPCIASAPEPPAAIVLDLDHSDDPTDGQQVFAC